MTESQTPRMIPAGVQKAGTPAEQAPGTAVPVYETHMGLGADPAGMSFEVVDPTEPDVEGPEAAPTGEVAAAVQDPVTETLNQVAEPMAEIIELAEARDEMGKVWLLLPISDWEFRVARRLPQRRYVAIIQTFRRFQDIKEMASSGSGNGISQYSDEQLIELLTLGEKFMERIMNPEDFERLTNDHLDSLTDPISFVDLMKAMNAVLPRYMKGTGATEGKS